jgi:predicted DNA-binding protein
MIDVYRVSNNKLIGSITPADLEVLREALEEESPDDHDYYITADTIEIIADGKATEHLVGLLRAALGADEGVDIRWAERSAN